MLWWSIGGVYKGVCISKEINTTTQTYKHTNIQVEEHHWSKSFTKWWPLSCVNEPVYIYKEIHTNIQTYIIKTSLIKILNLVCIVMIHVLVIKRILACNKNTRLCVSKAHKTYKWPKSTKKFASRSVFVYMFVFIKPKEIQTYVFFTKNFKVFCLCVFW